jgi:hypothetical protein
LRKILRLSKNKRNKNPRSKLGKAINLEDLFKKEEKLFPLKEMMSFQPFSETICFIVIQGEKKKPKTM